MHIANTIRDLRKQNGISQEQLAERLNVSRQSVSKWETGQSIPELDKISEMSVIFGVSTDYLINGVETKQNPSMINLSNKLFIFDANKKKLSAFESFEIDTILGAKNSSDSEFPVCVIFGVNKGIFGIKRRIALGYYITFEDAQHELECIAEASKNTTSYQLKYAAKMNGVRIIRGTD